MQSICMQIKQTYTYIHIHLCKWIISCITSEEIWWRKYQMGNNSKCVHSVLSMYFSAMFAIQIYVNIEVNLHSLTFQLYMRLERLGAGKKWRQWSPCIRGVGGRQSSIESVLFRTHRGIKKVTPVVKLRGKL